MIYQVDDLNQMDLNMAFIKADVTKVCEELISWQTPLVARNRNSLAVEHVNGNFYMAYKKLFPLTSVEIRRYLLVPTNSDWVAIMDNSWLGTDRTCPWVLADRLKTEHIYMFHNKVSGECMVDYSNIAGGELIPIRTVGVMKELRWEFENDGEPFPFEQTENYNNRLVKSRFTSEQLDEFLKHFGISAFDVNFYMPEARAVLVKKIGPYFPATKEMPFQVRK